MNGVSLVVSIVAGGLGSRNLLESVKEWGPFSDKLRLAPFMPWALRVSNLTCSNALRMAALQDAAKRTVHHLRRLLLGGGQRLSFPSGLRTHREALLLFDQLRSPRRATGWSPDDHNTTRHAHSSLPLSLLHGASPLRAAPACPFSLLLLSSPSGRSVGSIGSSDALCPTPFLLRS